MYCEWGRWRDNIRTVRVKTAIHLIHPPCSTPYLRGEVRIGASQASIWDPLVVIDTHCHPKVSQLADTAIKKQKVLSCRQGGREGVMHSLCACAHLYGCVWCASVCVRVLPLISLCRMLLWCRWLTAESSCCRRCAMNGVSVRYCGSENNWCTVPPEGREGGMLGERWSSMPRVYQVFSLLYTTLPNSSLCRTMNPAKLTQPSHRMWCPTGKWSSQQSLQAKALSIPKHA